MLIDSFLPRFDFNEVHSIEIEAPAVVTYDALLTADLGGSTIVRVLMGIRSLPSLLRGRSPRSREPLTLRNAHRAGFALLAEDRPREAVLGVEGQFWKLRPDLCAIDATAFSAPVPHGVARAAWNFSVAALGESRARLTTETRILCGDAESKRTFGRYWAVIRPGSAIIRLALLRAIAKEARRAGRG